MPRWWQEMEVPHPWQGDRDATSVVGGRRCHIRGRGWRCHIQCKKMEVAHPPQGMLVPDWWHGTEVAHPWPGMDVAHPMEEDRGDRSMGGAGGGGLVAGVGGGRGVRCPPGLHGEAVGLADEAALQAGPVRPHTAGVAALRHPHTEGALGDRHLVVGHLHPVHAWGRGDTPSSPSHHGGGRGSQEVWESLEGVWGSLVGVWGGLRDLGDP